MQPFGDSVTAAIVAFLTRIGIEVRAEPIAEPTFLPGIQIVHGALVVDEAALLYPGDLLHEGGHLAVAPPERRRAMHLNAGGDPAEEMMALAWSYAAALAIPIDPAIVFHQHGYRGDATSLLNNFAQGHVIALPMLQWVGLTLDSQQAAMRQLPAYPHMLRWLREA